MANQYDTSSRPGTLAAASLSAPLQQSTPAPPEPDLVVLIEIFTDFMHNLNTIAREQYPDKAGALKRDFSVLRTQIESGVTKPDGFPLACKTILTTHLGDQNYVPVYNKAKDLVDRYIAQQTAARKQRQAQLPQARAETNGAFDRQQQPPPQQREKEPGELNNGQKTSTAPAPVETAAGRTASRAEVPLPTANSRHNELYMAVSNGQEIAVKRLLKAGMDPNAPKLIRIDNADHLDYPLLVAAKAGFLKIFELLLEHGADASLRKAGGHNSLYHACTGGHLKVVKMLLAAGVGPNITLDSGYTPLMIAAEANFPSIVACLLEAGANLHMIAGSNDCEIYNVTALYNAAEMNNKECCKLLVKAGAELDVVTNQGLTPIHMAAKKGALETVRYLISVGADIEKPDNKGRRPLFTAVNDGKYETVRVLLTAGAEKDAVTQDGVNALIQACINTNLEIAKLLIDAGADVNSNIDLPLDHPKHGYTPLIGALSMQNDATEIVRILLSAGAKLDCTYIGYYTPLAAACENGHTDTVRCLLENGADGDHMDTKYPDCVTYTPLFIACQEGHVEIVKLLLDFGVVRTRRDMHNKTCLAVAAYHDENLEIVRLILDTPEGKLMVNIPDKDGRTPIMITKSLAIMKAVIDKGASVKSVDEDGNRPLHWSVINKSPPAVICTLVAAGADVMAVNGAQLTPADLAMKECNTLAEALLRRLETAGNRTRVTVPVVASPSPPVHNVPIETEDRKIEDIDSIPQPSDTEGNRARVSVLVVPVQQQVVPSPPSSTVQDVVSIETEDTKVEGNIAQLDGKTRVSVPVVAVQEAAQISPSPTVDNDCIEADAKVEAIDSIQQPSDTENRARVSVPVVPVQHNVPIETEDTQVEDANHTQQLSDNEVVGSVAPRKYKKKLRPCTHCGEVTHRRCAGCSVFFYCSKQCQKTGYAAHKKACLRIREDAGAGVKVSTSEECTSDATADI